MPHNPHTLFLSRGCTLPGVLLPSTRVPRLTTGFLPYRPLFSVRSVWSGVAFFGECGPRFLDAFFWPCDGSLGFFYSLPSVPSTPGCDVPIISYSLFHLFVVVLFWDFFQFTNGGFCAGVTCLLLFNASPFCLVLLLLLIDLDLECRLATHPPPTTGPPETSPQEDILFDLYAFYWQ